MAGIGPMMGQAMYFQRIAKPNGNDEPYSIDRYVTESRRLLEVLDKRLKNREFLVGGSYSIVDMATYPWARSFFWATVPVDGLDHPEPLVRYAGCAAENPGGAAAAGAAAIGLR